MKQKIMFLLCALLISLDITGQEITLDDSNKEENEENLDLEVAATIFGESSDLEEFEKKLNDPDNKVSNLDLNKDGEVDYLKVVEKTDGNTRTVYVQACVTEDTFKNVASIVVKKDKKNKASVTVIGDTEIYGEEYVIVPTYKTTPAVVIWFWGPSYRVWVSPYRFGYYPAYYRPWTVAPTARYKRNVRVRVRPTRVYRTPRGVRVRH